MKLKVFFYNLTSSNLSLWHITNIAVKLQRAWLADLECKLTYFRTIVQYAMGGKKLPMITNCTEISLKNIITTLFYYVWTYTMHSALKNVNCWNKWMTNTLLNVDIFKTKSVSSTTYVSCYKTTWYRMCTELRKIQFFHRRRQTYRKCNFHFQCTIQFFLMMFRSCKCQNIEK